MRLRDGLDDGQAQPGRGFASRRYRGETLEALERLRDIIRVQALSAVADPHVCKARIGVSAGLHQDRTARGGILHRVAQQVVDRLDEAVLVGNDVRAMCQLFSNAKLLRLGCCVIHPGRCAHGIGEIDLGAPQRYRSGLGPGLGEQTRDHLFHAIRRPADGCARGLQFFAQLCARGAFAVRDLLLEKLLDEVRAADDGRKRTAQIVGDHAEGVGLECIGVPRELMLMGQALQGVAETGDQRLAFPLVFDAAQLGFHPHAEDAHDALRALGIGDGKIRKYREMPDHAAAAAFQRHAAVAFLARLAGKLPPQCFRYQYLLPLVDQFAGRALQIVLVGKPGARFPPAE